MFFGVMLYRITRKLLILKHCYMLQCYTGIVKTCQNERHSKCITFPPSKLDNVKLGSIYILKKPLHYNFIQFFFSNLLIPLIFLRYIFRYVVS